MDAGAVSFACAALDRLSGLNYAEALLHDERLIDACAADKLVAALTGLRIARNTLTAAGRPDMAEGVRQAQTHAARLLEALNP